MTVVVPVARAHPQRRTDRDVVDDELGRDDRRERRERERELFETRRPCGRRGAATRPATRSRSRLRGGAARSASTLAKPCAICAATCSKKSSGRSEIGLQLARRRARRAITPSPIKRIAALARGDRPGVHFDRLAAGDATRSRRRRARDTSARPRRSRAAGSSWDRRASVSIFASSSRHADSSSSTSSARSVPGLLQARQAARLDRVEPGERLVAGAGPVTPRPRACRRCVRAGRRPRVSTTSKSSGRRRIAIKSRSTSGGVGIAGHRRVLERDRLCDPQDPTERVLRFLDAVLVERDGLDERLGESPRVERGRAFVGVGDAEARRARPRPGRRPSATRSRPRTPRRRGGATAPRRGRAAGRRRTRPRSRARPCGR